MQQGLNRASPTLGMALGYFLILYAVQEGHIQATHQPEAVAMAGVVVTNIIMEVKGLFAWVGGLFRGNKGEK